MAVNVPFRSHLISVHRLWKISDLCRKLRNGGTDAPSARVPRARCRTPRMFSGISPPAAAAFGCLGWSRRLSSLLRRSFWSHNIGFHSAVRRHHPPILRCSAQRPAPLRLSRDDAGSSARRLSDHLRVRMNMIAKVCLLHNSAKLPRRGPDHDRRRAAR